MGNWEKTNDELSLKMIRIIEEGKIPIYKAKCWHCGCVFEFDDEDTQIKSVVDGARLSKQTFVECPCCGKHIQAWDIANDKLTII